METRSHSFCNAYKKQQYSYRFSSDLAKKTNQSKAHLNNFRTLNLKTTYLRHQITVVWETKKQYTMQEEFIFSLSFDNRTWKHENRIIFCNEAPLMLKERKNAAQVNNVLGQIMKPSKTLFEILGNFLCLVSICVIVFWLRFHFWLCCLFLLVVTLLFLSLLLTSFFAEDGRKC